MRNTRRIAKEFHPHTGMKYGFIDHRFGLACLGKSSEARTFLTERKKQPTGAAGADPSNLESVYGRVCLAKLIA